MMEKLKDILNKYRFAVLVALAGVVLMLLPACLVLYWRMNFTTCGTMV